MMQPYQPPPYYPPPPQNWGPHNGWVPPHQRPLQPVVAQPQRKTHHGMHAMMTVCTGGLWAPVWLAIWLSNRAKVRHL